MKRIYCHFRRKESREAIVSTAILFHMRLFKTEIWLPWKRDVMALVLYNLHSYLHCRFSVAI